MKKIFPLCLLLSSLASAQDAFDELDATSLPPPAATPPPPPAPVPEALSAKENPPAAAESTPPAAESAEAPPADLEDALVENPPAPPAPVEKAEAKPPVDADVPDDVKQLEQDLGDTAPPEPPVAEAPKNPAENLAEKPAEKLSEAAKPEPMPDDMPKALLEAESSQDFAPSEEFSRIPLRPQMSDANWKKWAGPLLDKIYRIRRRDTLWNISEKFFGNPYLWPKVWQLNAHLSNPHFIDVGREMQFVPGNPNSAPEIAMHLPEAAGKGEWTALPLVALQQKLSLIDSLEIFLKAQLREDQHPPFQYFLCEDKPKLVTELPRRGFGEKIFYKEGQSFDLDVEDGTYSVVRPSGTVRTAAFKKNFRGERVHWVGTIVVKDKKAKLTQAFGEVAQGDGLVARDFNVSALQLHEAHLGEEEGGPKNVRLIPLQEGFSAAAGPYSLIGARFKNEEEPVTGAILNFTREGKKIGTGLVVHRDGRLATLWVVDSEREITAADTIE